MPLKAKEKLSRVPRPSHRRASKQAETVATAAVKDTGPDLSHIAEGLRGMAVPIGDLRFDPANPRTHDDRNLDAIRGSLAVYGQVKPVVARKDIGVVVAGNGTLQAALSLGWTYLAAVYVQMDSATAAGYSIADNRTTELGGWDREALDKLMHEAITGNDERLDRMMSELAETEKLIPDDPSSEPEPKTDESTQGLVECPECGHKFSR